VRYEGEGGYVSMFLHIYNINVTLTSNVCYLGMGNFKSHTTTELMAIYYHRGNGRWNDAVVSKLNRHMNHYNGTT
jgi:hypothetical protein